MCSALRNVDNAHDAAVSLSNDGQILYVYRDNGDDHGDLYQSNLVGEIFTKPVKLKGQVNTYSWDGHCSLSPDGQTLYFSSEGHNSMGGYDLFKCEWNSETNNWSKAVNLGYPINSTDDDRSISISADHTVAYVSAVRPGGYGDLDIYRIKYNTNQKFVVYKGKISYEDSTKAPTETIANIVALEQKTNEEYSFTTNSKNGLFILALPAGTYNLSVNSVGYKNISETIIVEDIGNSAIERKKEFKLVK